MMWRGLFVFILFMTGFLPGLAKSEGASPKGQWGVIVVEGASVFKNPDFDSPVIEYLDPGKKFRISRKVYKGKGGFGTFYKIIVKPKVWGYVADTEVAPEFKADDAGAAESQGGAREKNEKFESAQDRAPQEPLFFTRYLGVGVALVDFKEKIAGRWYNSSTPIFGLKMTGPGSVLTDVPLDLNLLFSFAPPDYYAKVLPGPHTGFFIVADIVFQLPLMEWSSGLITYGLGPLLVYTDFDLIVGSRGVDNRELRAGSVFMAGVSQRFLRHWVLRGELKYYWEKSQYMGTLLSLQYQY